VAGVKSALVTGVAGQDGIYLARRLRGEGIRVVGTVKPGSPDHDRVAAYLDDVEVVPVDLADAEGLRRLVATHAPDEVYNLAGMTSVARSWDHPEETRALNADAVEVLVDSVLALRDRTGQDVRFVQASTAEVVDGASPYAQSKAAAEEIVRAAREESGLHACFARLHIHESPLRGPEFVSRKITRAVAEIVLGQREILTLGNLDVVRDWGFAGEYVAALRLMASRTEPVDLPIGTGEPHTLADLVAAAFAAGGINDATPHLVQDPQLIRPADIPVLVADPGPAEQALGWRATVTLDALLRHMVQIDLERLRTGVAESLSYLAAPAPA
jgi:GDPmannose 4,6-dehydratase